MDSNNLATLFGPNILHKAKSTEKEYSVESLERADERREVIDVVKDMIDRHKSLYIVSSYNNVNVIENKDIDFVKQYKQSLYQNDSKSMYKTR